MKNTLPILLLMAGALTLNAATPEKPNIILILADDLGYGDVGFTGGKAARTPELDKLAAEGLVLSDFHTNGVACTPTRAAMMTGRYQQRSGLSNVLFVGRESQKGTGMAPHEVLIPERLREAGYKSALMGKWHLGSQPGAHPMQQGFDEFIGFLEGHVDYTNKWNRMWPDWNRGYEKFTEDGYLPHLLTRHTIDFIEANKDRPFFVYLAHACPHTPHMLPGDPPVYGSDAKGKAENEQPEKYVPMITEMDNGIGEIANKLRELRIDKKTLVIFTSDNGQVADLAPVASAGPYRGGKGDMYEGGHRVPFLAWWPGSIAPGTISSQTAMTADLFPTFLDLAGLPMPSERPLDGLSLKETLLSGKPLPERILFWDNAREKAVRDGKWKLVDINDRKKNIHARELYDLEADAGETNDLAASQPEIAARLFRELEKWSADVAEGATPQPHYEISSDEVSNKPKHQKAP